MATILDPLSPKPCRRSSSEWTNCREALRSQLEVCLLDNPAGEKVDRISNAQFNGYRVGGISLAIKLRGQLS